jgi:hypothetical protein
MRKLLLLTISFFPVFVFAQSYNYMMRLKSVNINGVKDSTGVKDRELKYFENLYVDSVAEIRITPSSSSVLFWITNKSEKKITINYDKFVLIDISGGSHKVAPAETRIIDISLSQKDNDLLPNSKISETLMPVDAAKWIDNDWGGKPVLPSSEKKRKTLLGKEMRFFIPIVIDGKTIEYTFNYVMDFKKY